MYRPDLSVGKSLYRLTLRRYSGLHWVTDNLLIAISGLWCSALTMTLFWNLKDDVWQKKKQLRSVCWWNCGKQWVNLFSLTRMVDHWCISWPDISVDGTVDNRHLQTECWLTFVPEAMQCLESLRLMMMITVPGHVEFDFDSLKYLHLLEKVSAQFFELGSPVTTIKAALRRAVDNHPNGPVLDFH